MNCGIIYYSARKTSYCEKALKKCFAELGLSFGTAAFAVRKEALGTELMKAFEKNDAVFIVGGLEFEDCRGIRDIISQAAAASNPQLVRRLENPDGDDGYLLRAGNQLLVMLPDEPEQLEGILHGVLAEYIKNMITVNR